MVLSGDWENFDSTCSLLGCLYNCKVVACSHLCNSVIVVFEEFDCSGQSGCCVLYSKVVWIDTKAPRPQVSGLIDCPNIASLTLNVDENSVFGEFEWFEGRTHSIFLRLTKDWRFISCWEHILSPVFFSQNEGHIETLRAINFKNLVALHFYLVWVLFIVLGIAHHVPNLSIEHEASTVYLSILGGDQHEMSPSTNVNNFVALFKRKSHRVKLFDHFWSF